MTTGGPGRTEISYRTGYQLNPIHHVITSYRLFGESDAESEADGAGAEALAVGPLAGDAGGVPVEVGPVVVGRLRVLPHFERDVLGRHHGRRHVGRRQRRRSGVHSRLWISECNV